MSLIRRKSKQSAIHSILIKTQPAATMEPVNTVQLQFNVEKEEDPPQGGLGQEINIPPFTMKLDHEHILTASRDNTDFVTFYVNDILHRNGCIAHDYSPHNHLMPVGYVQVSDYIVGDPLEFETAAENIEYHDDFESKFVHWMHGQEMVRCHRYEEMMMRNISIKDDTVRSNSTQNGSQRTLLQRLQSDGTGFFHDQTMNIRKEMQFDAQREQGGVEMAQPHSFALNQINALRRADGEASWQTVMNGTPSTFGDHTQSRQHAMNQRINVHFNTDTSPVTMTKYNERRMITEVEGEHRSMVQNKEPVSYLSSVNSSMGMAIAFLPYLPWGASVCMVLLTFMCIFCSIKCVRKIAEMTRKTNYHRVRSLNAPRNSEVESRSSSTRITRYDVFPTPSAQESE